MVASVLTSLTALVSPDTFALWAVQEPSDNNNIQDIKYSFAAAYESTVGELLREIYMGEYGVEVSSRICIETCNCVMYPHAMPLHSLGSNPCFTYSDDGDEPIHAWADNMVVGKATLYIRLNSACILMTLKKIMSTRWRQ